MKSHATYAGDPQPGRHWTRDEAIGVFWARVDKRGEDDCWPWLGRSDRRGYGRFQSARLPGTYWAHRIAYQLSVGPVPDELVIDHLCRNPSCVNPSHMEPVTNGENVLRGDTAMARNRAKTHCYRGHPFDEANTHITPLGARKCRQCDRENKRRRLAARRTPSA